MALRIIKMKIIYISSPYTIGDVGANVRVQIEAAHVIMDMGHCPVTPLLSHYLHIHRPRPYDDWLKIDIAILKRMDLVLRLAGESKGADIETKHAAELGIPVAHGFAQLKSMLRLMGDEV